MRALMLYWIKLQLVNTAKEVRALVRASIIKI